MSDLLPSAESVAPLIERFDAELGRATTVRDSQAIRDRYLGRKNSIVASWMQMIAGAPVDQKKSIGRYANELKQAIEARWTRYEETVRDAAPAGAVDVTLPGRVPLLGHRRPITPRATCRTPCTWQRRSRASRGAPTMCARCFARILRRFRSGTCRRTSRRSASSRRAECIAATN